MSVDATAISTVCVDFELLNLGTGFSFKADMKPREQKSHDILPRDSQRFAHKTQTGCYLRCAVSAKTHLSDYLPLCVNDKYD